MKGFQILTGDTLLGGELRYSLFLVNYHGDKSIVYVRCCFVHVDVCGDHIFFSVAFVQKFVGFVKEQRQLFGGEFLRCGNDPVAHYIYIGSFHNLYFA